MSRGRAHSKVRRDGRYARAIERQLALIAREPTAAPIEQFLRAGEQADWYSNEEVEVDE